MLFIKKAKAKQWRHNLKHHTCVVYKVFQKTYVQAKPKKKKNRKKGGKRKKKKKVKHEEPDV